MEATCPVCLVLRPGTRIFIGCPITEGESPLSPIEQQLLGFAGTIRKPRQALAAVRQALLRRFTSISFPRQERRTDVHVTARTKPMQHVPLDSAVSCRALLATSPSSWGEGWGEGNYGFDPAALV